jgi:hypothetical protein
MLWKIVAILLIIVFELRTYSTHESLQRLDEVKKHPLIGLNNPYGVEKILYEAQVIRYGSLDAGDQLLPPQRICLISIYQINKEIAHLIELQGLSHLNRLIQKEYNNTINNKELMNYFYNSERLEHIKKQGWHLLKDYPKYSNHQLVSFPQDRIAYCLGFARGTTQLNTTAYYAPRPHEHDELSIDYPFPLYWEEVELNDWTL